MPAGSRDSEADLSRKYLCVHGSQSQCQIKGENTVVKHASYYGYWFD